MKEIKDYAEYESLFKDDLVVAVRKLLKGIEDNNGYLKEFEDSKDHNVLKEYFNKFALHKKIPNDKQFKNWRND